MIKTSLKALGLIMAAGLGFAVWYWPHVPGLLQEGFPAERFPADGRFAEIAAAPNITPILEGRLAEPNDWAQQLFDERESAALLVARNGQLRLEHYANGTDAGTMFNSFSMAKSLIGLLVLKAVAEGKIESLDDPVGQYLPGRGDAAFQAVSIRRFLSMRSGVRFGAPNKLGAAAAADVKDQSYNPFGPIGRLHAQGLGSVDAELRTSGGDQFDYQDVNTAVLGAMLSDVYQQNLPALLEEKIWHPAGAQSAQWRRYSSADAVSPYCCIYATARDWLRVALYVNGNGTHEVPLLPQELFEQWMGASISDEEAYNNAYGLHLYHNVLDREGEPLQGRFSFKFGTGGQVIYLMPSQDLVVVRFGSAPSPLHSTLYSAWRSIDE